MVCLGILGLEDLSRVSIYPELGLSVAAHRVLELVEDKELQIKCFRTQTHNLRQYMT